MRYYIRTFGCQMNQSDSRRIANFLEKSDYTEASELTEADLIVVNMCSVRQSAVDRVYGLIPKFKKLKENNPDLKTLLTGCILKEDRKKLEPEFDYVLSKKTLKDWGEFLEQEQWTYFPDPRGKKGKEYNANYLEISPNYRGQGRAFVPISTGCDNFCSFCVVPYTRGPEICRNFNKIKKEVQDLVQQNFKEIWLLGQNVNSYKYRTESQEINFSDLLATLNEIEGDFWLKFTSSNPNAFDQVSIKKISNLEKVKPYINLPLQSGDDEILEKMNRPYSVREYEQVVQKIREEFDRISLSTDIIVGFPGETKQQFQNTVRVFKQMNFDMAYIAQYSPRPQTAASKMKDNVRSEEKDRREKILTEVLEKQALEFNQSLIDKKMKVITLDKKEDKLIGKNKYNKTVKFNGSEDLIGQFVPVKIRQASSWGLTGEEQ